MSTLSFTIYCLVRSFQYHAVLQTLTTRSCPSCNTSTIQRKWKQTAGAAANTTFTDTLAEASN